MSGNADGIALKAARVPQAASATPTAPPANARHIALGERLPQDPRPAGAERRAQRELLPPPGEPGEDQVAHVRAGDEQHQRHRGKKEHQRGLQMAHEVLPERHHVDADALVRVGVRGLERPRDRVHLGACLGEADTGAKTPDHRGGVHVARQEQLVIVLADGQEDVVEETSNHADADVRRHDADHGVRLAVERDWLADDARVGGEAAAPQALTEQHDLRPAGLVLPRLERPSEQRLHPEDQEVTGRHTSADQTFRLRLPGEREHLQMPGRDPVERPRAGAPIEEVRVRHGAGVRRRHHGGFGRRR